MLRLEAPYTGAPCRRRSSLRELAAGKLARKSPRTFRRGATIQNVLRLAPHTASWAIHKSVFFPSRFVSVRRFRVDVDQSKQTRRSYPPGDWSRRVGILVAAPLFRTHRASAMNVLAIKDNDVLYQALGVQRLLNLNDVLRLLRSEVERAGSQRAFAEKAGVNVSAVSKTLRRMVLPSEKILGALNLRVVYLSK